MIEKEQREAERRPITKITHKGEIEIESQEPVKVAEPVEVRNNLNIILHHIYTLQVKYHMSTCVFFVTSFSLSLLPERRKSQQNVPKLQRRKQRVRRQRKTLQTNTSLIYLTYTAKSAQVNPTISRNSGYSH